VTDSKLRELERRWKETGSVEDEPLQQTVMAGPHSLNLHPV